MAGMSQGAPKQGMQGEGDEGMQRRGTKWRTKALFGLKDELLCCGTVCWSRSEELEGEKFGAIVMLHFLSAPCQWRRTENGSRLTHSTNFLDLKHSWGVFETVC